MGCVVYCCVDKKVDVVVGAFNFYQKASKQHQVDLSLPPIQRAVGSLHVSTLTDCLHQHLAVTNTASDAAYWPRCSLTGACELISLPSFGFRLPFNDAPFLSLPSAATGASEVLLVLAASLSAPGHHINHSQLPVPHFGQATS